MAFIGCAARGPTTSTQNTWLPWPDCSSLISETSYCSSVSSGRGVGTKPCWAFGVARTWTNSLKPGESGLMLKGSSPLVLSPSSMSRLNCKTWGTCGNHQQQQNVLERLLTSVPSKTTIHLHYQFLIQVSCCCFRGVACPSGALKYHAAPPTSIVFMVKAMPRMWRLSGWASREAQQRCASWRSHANRVTAVSACGGSLAPRLLAPLSPPLATPTEAA